MKLIFFAEYIADPESAKTFLTNRRYLQANRPICDKSGQEMSEVKIGGGVAAVW